MNDLSKTACECNLRHITAAWRLSSVFRYTSTVCMLDTTLRGSCMICTLYLKWMHVVCGLTYHCLLLYCTVGVVQFFLCPLLTCTQISIEKRKKMLIGLNLCSMQHFKMKNTFLDCILLYCMSCRQ